MTRFPPSPGPKGSHRNTTWGAPQGVRWTIEFLPGGFQQCQNRLQPQKLVLNTRMFKVLMILVQPGNLRFVISVVPGGWEFSDALTGTRVRHNCNHRGYAADPRALLTETACNCASPGAEYVDGEFGLLSDWYGWEPDTP